MYITSTDALIYVGMGKTMFKEVAKDLKKYGYGRNKVWYKKTDLDAMMEDLLLPKPSSKKVS